MGKPDHTLQPFVLNGFYPADRTQIRIVVDLSVSGVRIYCSCETAKATRLCVHRLDIITNEWSSISEADQLQGKLRTLFACTALPKAAFELLRLKSEQKFLEEQIEYQERFLVSLMNGTPIEQSS